ASLAARPNQLLRCREAFRHRLLDNDRCSVSRGELDQRRVRRRAGDDIDKVRLELAEAPLGVIEDGGDLQIFRQLLGLRAVEIAEAYTFRALHFTPGGELVACPKASPYRREPQLRHARRS